MKFSEIPGLSRIKEVLIRAVEREHLAHAQLFIGKAGGGHLALALAYATYINCENKQGDDACGECPSCRKFQKLAHPDLHFIVPTATTKKITKRNEATTIRFYEEWKEFIQEHDGLYGSLIDWTQLFGAENKQAMIPKEESKNIIRDLSIKPYGTGYKVMIIWLPELMQAPAANAILKILEEPPERTLFFLVTNDVDALLPTIVSRTQIIHVPSFQDEDIADYLQQQKGMNEQKALSLAYISDGNLWEAISLSEDISDGNEDFFKQWMRACYKPDFTSLVKEWVEKFNALGKEMQKSLFQYALNLFRESMIISLGDESMVRIEDEHLNFVKNFSKVLNERNLPYLVDVFNDAFFHIERNANPKLTFIHLSIQVARAFKM